MNAEYYIQFFGAPQKVTALEAFYDMQAIGQPEYSNGADLLYKEDNHWRILAKTYLKNK